MKKFTAMMFTVMMLCAACCAQGEAPGMPAPNEMPAMTPAPAMAEEIRLPEYVYTGEDPMEKALTDLYAGYPVEDLYATQDGYVTIPCPVILKTDRTDGDHATVYFVYWIMNYALDVNVLENISGGKIPGMVEMEKDGDGWKITGGETEPDEVKYAEAVRRFAKGDRELEEKYLAAADLEAAVNAVKEKRPMGTGFRSKDMGIQKP